MQPGPWMPPIVTPSCGFDPWFSLISCSRQGTDSRITTLDRAATSSDEEGSQNCVTDRLKAWEWRARRRLSAFGLTTRLRPGVWRDSPPSMATT
jgi:hypothetical protein